MSQDDADEFRVEPLGDAPTPARASLRAGRALSRRQKVSRGVAAAMAVLVVLVVVAAQADLGDRLRTWWIDWRTPTLTSVTLPAQPLTTFTTGAWERLPNPQSARSNLLWYAVPPDDPQTAYACSGEPHDMTTGRTFSGPLAIWRTHDSGMHWTKLATIEVTGTGCWIGIAPDDPHVLAFTVSSNADCAQSSIWLSRDGGDTWSRTAPITALPTGVQYCSTTITFSARHLFAGVSYVPEGASPSQMDSYHAAAFHSSDGGRTWGPFTPPPGAIISPWSPLGTVTGPLADGQTLLAMQSDPANQYLILWQSRDAAQSWTRVWRTDTRAGGRPLTPPGMHEATQPFYLVSQSGPSSYLLGHVQQVTGDGRLATLPPLPVAGADALRTGITQALTVTPGGNLLALGIGPHDTVPSDTVGQSSVNTQWLWLWDAQAARWSVASAPLDVPWPTCGDGCWLPYTTTDASGTMLWLLPFDLSNLPEDIAPSSQTYIYCLRLPGIA